MEIKTEKVGIKMLRAVLDNEPITNNEVARITGFTGVMARTHGNFLVSRGLLTKEVLRAPEPKVKGLVRRTIVWRIREKLRPKAIRLVAEQYGDREVNDEL